jgi:hypothetical protein
MRLTELMIDVLKQKCTKIHYFGLGFIQLKLGETSRLHFYTGELPAIVPQEEIHNHRYDFRSVILRGALKQTFFDATFSQQNPTHECVFESCKPPGQESEPEPLSLPCQIEKLASVTLLSGSEYRIDHNTFHRVEALGECITFLERSKIRKQFAQILRPIGAEKVCPFSKEVPEAQLWEIVEQMLGSRP